MDEKTLLERKRRIELQIAKYNEQLKTPCGPEKRHAIKFRIKEEEGSLTGIKDFLKDFETPKKPKTPASERKLIKKSMTVSVPGPKPLKARVKKKNQKGNKTKDLFALKE